MVGIIITHPRSTSGHLLELLVLGGGVFSQPFSLLRDLDFQVITSSGSLNTVIHF